MVWDLVYEAKSRKMQGHAFKETIKPRGLFDCRKKVKYYWVWEGSRCSRLVWWHMARTSQLCCIESKSGSRIDVEHIYLLVRWNSKDHLPNIRKTTPRVCFISLESSSRIRLKNTRKCPAKSNPHERITPSSLRNETRKTRSDRPENKTRKRWLYPD